MLQVVRVLVFGKRLFCAVSMSVVRGVFCMRVVKVALVRVGFVTARMAMEVVVHGSVGVLMQVRMQDVLLIGGRFCRPGGGGGDVNVLVVHRLYPLYSRNRKSGAPKNEVMAPIGRMMGEMTTRATRSLASMMAEPSTSEAGSRKR